MGSWIFNAYITGTGTQSVTIPTGGAGGTPATGLTSPLGEFLDILAGIAAVISIALYYRAENCKAFNIL